MMKKENLQETVVQELKDLVQAAQFEQGKQQACPPQRPISLNSCTGKPHISRDPGRGYVEYDPYLEVCRHGKKEIIHGQHGLMDIPAEIGLAAYEAGVLFTPFFQKIFNK